MDGVSGLWYAFGCVQCLNFMQGCKHLPGAQNDKHAVIVYIYIDGLSETRATFDP